MLLRSSIAATALLGALLITPVHAQDLSKYPDWSGQWQKVPDGGPPRYDPSKPDGAGQQAPLKDKYKQMHEASMADQAKGGQGLYISSVRCIPMGMPYEMSIVFPFEFVVTPVTTFILFEPSTSQPRRIYTDGREWPKDLDPTFTGYSIGKWIDTDGDGKYDELDVETRNMRLPRIYDQSGIPFSEDGQAVITERIYLDKDKPGVIHDEMTTVDSALTRPWTVLKTYRRLAKTIWTENNCAEGNDNIVIGKQIYLLSGDGYLMPTRPGQAPPDPRYFKTAPK